MRPQPDLLTVLTALTKQIDTAASDCSDALLREHTLVPAAALLQFITAKIDTYVADELVEIEELTNLLSEARDLFQELCPPDVDVHLADAGTASGRLRGTELNRISDQLHFDLIAITAAAEASATTPDQVALLERIWALQVKGLPTLGGAQW